MAVLLVKQILTDAMQSPSVPGLADIKARMEAELERKLGETIDVDELPDLLHMGRVNDFYASFEWSDGGILHAHICFWVVGAPRIDKVAVPREKGDDTLEIDACSEDGTALPQEEAASFLDFGITL